MDAPLTKKQRYRARKRQRLLEQGKGFVPGYRSLRNSQFWADVNILGNKKVNNTKVIGQQIVKKESTCEVIDMNTSIQHEPDLTDDNSPSIPLAQTQAQGTLQTLKKPLLNIQEKTQEKLKFNQKQQEQPNNDQNKEQNPTLNEEKSKTPNENQNEEQNKSINMTQSYINETTFYNTEEKIREKSASELNSGSQIPVLMKQPLTNTNIGATTSNSPLKTIPTLTNQVKPKKIPNTPNTSNNYQNMHNVVCPPTVDPDQYLTTNLEMLYHSIYAQEPIIPRSALPSGVPLTFLLQQANFGAIQPQFPGYMPNNSGLMTNIIPMQTNQQTFSQQQIYTDSNFPTNTSTYINNEVPVTVPSQPYSPSDLFTEDGEVNKAIEEGRESSSSPDICKVGQRRQSAFDRLGPLTQPKKPKLTINLSFNKEQAIREVVGEDESNKYIPVHMREDIINSSDEIVTTYLDHWPWKNHIVVRKSVGARVSKSAMIMEQEQMEEVYERGNIFIQLSVKGYPNTWSKEDVLDTLLENLKGKSFVPCFIEFTPTECKFLVIRSRPALIAIHKLGFTARKDDVILNITIYDIDLDIKTLNFQPKVVLRQRIMRGLEHENKLNLRQFTLQPDVSHFIYYPLNRISNQIGIIDLHVSIVWKNLTHLVLSHNRITSIEGFDLQHTTPLLQYLDISYNNIERIIVLLNCRKLQLKSLTLEGNPLCTDYREPQDYVKVAKMLFPMLQEIDGIQIPIKSDLPKINKNYCDILAKELVDKFLQTYFPILDSPPQDRDLIGDMYDTNAILTVTYNPILLSKSVWRRNRALFLFNRQTGDMIGGCLSTAKKIVKLLKKLPNLQHDPTSFTVDVLTHTNTSTVITICGVLKITTDSLAEDEPMLAFSKTVLLYTSDNVEYKIRNDMVYWDLPSEEYLKQAFTKTAIPLSKRTLNLTLDTPPDTDTKDHLVNIFMNLTELDRPHSERYLEEKDWNIKDALQFFTEIVKLNPADMINTSSSELVT